MQSPADVGRHQRCDDPSVDQPASNEPLPPAASPGGTVPDTPAPAVTALVVAKPDAARLPLLAVAVAGVIAGGLVVLAFVSVGSNAPVETAEAATVSPVAPAPLVESAAPPTWTGARRTTWARDGSKTITFTLAATRDLPVWMNHARPALVVRCLSRTTDVFVMLDTSADFEKDADRRTVRVQWDEDPERVQQWAVSETGRELFAPDGIDAVRRMTRARRLRFGFSPFNAQPVTAEFAVQGFDELAPLVARSCGWRLDDGVRNQTRN